jgi:hypothetical protein
MAIVNNVYRVFQDVFANYTGTLINYLPNLITGFIIIVIGYFAATLFGFVVRRLLYALNLDKKLRKADLEDSFGKVSLAKLFGTLTKWFIFFVFFAKGISFLQIGFIKVLSQQLAFWTFLVTIDIILIVLGFIFIDFVLYKVWEIRTKYDDIIQIIARVLVMLIIIFTTLDQQGINISFLKSIFLLILASVLLALSLAVGIGLGVGLSGKLNKVAERFGKGKRRR